MGHRSLDGFGMTIFLREVIFFSTVPMPCDVLFVRMPDRIGYGSSSCIFWKTKNFR